ncbi:putative Beta-glucosidase [Zostera marina]|uniref:Putative Beta-glucosidase n=1 Tax=Zostera marina TaxID=29655 RepID=A0A0K9PHR8_ZOSMR|nr:putative Beta-glucosidase [Zostera marina]
MKMKKKRVGGASAVVATILIGLFIDIQLCSAKINRESFPDGFVFGAASSAYQYEGAAKQGGRGPSIWDKFSHTFGKIVDFSNGDEDVSLIKDMGLDSYRFSISWSRIFPKGTGEVNQEGVKYYSNLIDALLSKEIQPYVTLYHWDLPQALEDKYHGWLDPQIMYVDKKMHY